MFKKTLIESLAVFAAFGIAAASFAGTANYKGKVISSGVKVIDGIAYIPLADAAKAMGGSVAKSGDAYTIEISSSVAGGANQINGLNGKIGQMLFTGKWRFEVFSVTIVPTFTEHYRPSPITINPSGVNDELVIVNGLVKNAQNDTEEIAMRTANPMHSTITDNQGASYGTPLDFDFPTDSGYGPELAPGAASKFNAVFECPKSTTLQSLIFSIANLSEMDKPADARIDISSVNPPTPGQ